MEKKTENAGNLQLHQANQNKKDEFYTALEDIENELKHYKSCFNGKTVFCNCDDPYESNFFKYFAMHFNSLGLKKLIATCYNGSPVQGEQLDLFDIVGLKLNGDTGTNINSRRAYKVVITEVKDENGDGKVDLSDVEYLIKNKKNILSLLDGNGDFRSKECIELLNDADIIVTNPPFSLFREYVNQLVEYDKKFLIIGNQNSVICKEIFPLIKENKLWFGASIHSGDREFRVPDDYPLEAASCCEREGKKYIRVKGIRWFTNLDFKEHHNPLPLYKRYTPEEYPRYDNYDAIEVSETKLIPEDYDGIMGVPVTFLDKYCPEQFEIIWQASGNTRASAPKEILDKLHYTPHREDRGGCAVIDNQRKYSRFLIKRKHEEIKK